MRKPQCRSRSHDKGNSIRRMENLPSGQLCLCCRPLDVGQLALQAHHIFSRYGPPKLDRMLPLSPWTNQHGTGYSETPRHTVPHPT